MPRSPILKPITRMLVDITCLFAAFSLTVWVSLNPEEDWGADAASHAAYFVVFTAIWCIIAIDRHHYNSRHRESLISILFSVTRIYFVTLLLSGFGLALLLRAGYSRLFFSAFALSALGILIAVVLASRPGLFVLRRRYHSRRVLMVGAYEPASRLAESFASDEFLDNQIVGFVDDDEVQSDALAEYGVPYLGKVKDLERLLVQKTIDVVYVCLPLSESYETVNRIVRLCETIGVPVRLASQMFPIRLTDCDVSHIGDVPLLSMMTRPGYLVNIRLERAVESITALLLLIVLAPLLAVIALIIKLESRGPVFTVKKQGHNGYQNNVYSFRVTRSVPVEDEAKSPVLLTPFGRFLRRYGLDELPSLAGIFLGRVNHMGIPSSSSNRDSGVDSGNGVDSASRKRRILPTITLAVVDTFCVTAAYVVAVKLTSFTPAIMELALVNYLPFLGVMLVTWYAAAIERRLWRWRTVEPVGAFVFELLMAVGSATILCGFLMAVLLPGIHSMRQFLALFCVLTFTSLLTFRLSARFLTRIFYILGYRIRRVVVVGVNERTEQLLQALGGEKRFGYRVVGVIEDDESRTAVIERIGLSYLGPMKAMRELLSEQRIDEVYVTLPVRSRLAEIKKVVSDCAHAGIPVHIVANVLPVSIAKSKTGFVHDIPVISFSPVSDRYVWLAVKRLTDFVASSILIVALAPLFAVLAVLIKRDSPGPVFFVQDRIGRSHRYFKMIKLRSMVSNAEELKEGLMDMNEADGPVFKIKRDPRITPLGHFLRKYSLDELPQLLNVWLGHMSLVGPRPLMPHEVDKFEWFERRRLSVKPGMTGLWQVSGRGDIPFREWVKMDLEYIDSWSTWQDFHILLKTFGAVFSGRGAA